MGYLFNRIYWHWSIFTFKQTFDLFVNENGRRGTQSLKKISVYNYFHIQPVEKQKKTKEQRNCTKDFRDISMDESKWVSSKLAGPLVVQLLLLLLLLSRFSRVRLCATPQTAGHQAPPSLGFSRQEHWSGLPFPSPMHESEK